MRDIIVALVEHGFDRRDLEDMGCAELKWWIDGVNQRNKQKADAERRAVQAGKQAQPSKRRRR